MRGEMPAVQTYTRAIENFSALDRDDILTRIRTDHEVTVSEPRRLVKEAGGEPSQRSGARGGFAKAVERTATLSGETPALRILQDGDEPGLKEYRDALEDPGVSPDLQNLRAGSPTLKISWKEFCKSVQDVAHEKLRDMEDVTREWTFDGTPMAGFFGLGLHRFSGTRRAWLRLRERPAGVFCQVNDGPWDAVGGVGSQTLDQILDRFIVEFEREPRRSARDDMDAPPLRLVAAA